MAFALLVCINDCYQIKNLNCKQQIVTVASLHNFCDVCSSSAACINSSLRGELSTPRRPGQQNKETFERPQ